MPVWGGSGGAGGARAKFQSSELPKQKATSLPNPRSLIGLFVLFLVGKYRKKEGRKKMAHVPSVLAAGVKLVTSQFSTRDRRAMAIAKTPVG